MTLAFLALSQTALTSVATAFLHSTIPTSPRAIDHIHVHPGVTSSSIQSANDGLHCDALGNDSEISSQMNKILMETRQELISDASKLKEMYPQSIDASDNEMRDGTLTPEQMANEVLLSARLDLPFLNRTMVGPSTIEGAGRGLFATEDIAEGEVITCYPGDGLLCQMPDDEADESEDGSGDEEEIYSLDVVLWGTHVPDKDRWDDDAVFDGTETKSPLTAYAVSVDDIYSVMGHPDLDFNPAYAGHYANDGAGHLALEKPNSEANIQAALELGLDIDEENIGVEDNIAAYVLKSLEVGNGMHKTLGGLELHVATVATRDIKAGDEIFVTYGPDYWLGYA